VTAAALRSRSKSYVARTSAYQRIPARTNGHQRTVKTFPRKSSRRGQLPPSVQRLCEATPTVMTSSRRTTIRPTADRTSCEELLYPIKKSSGRDGSPSQPHDQPLGAPAGAGAGSSPAPAPVVTDGDLRPAVGPFAGEGTCRQEFPTPRPSLTAARVRPDLSSRDRPRFGAQGWHPGRPPGGRPTPFWSMTVRFRRGSQGSAPPAFSRP